MSNDLVKFTYYPFEALGIRREETKKEMAESMLAIYSRKTKFDVFTNFTGTALDSCW
jgi:hypothetical protein